MRPIQIIVFCLYMCSLNLYAQVSVTGTVNDNTGESLPGVSILAKDGDRTFGSTTDINGRYEIKVNQGATLEFSFIGFAKQKVKVGTNKIINITLEPENEMLDEVVVIGYGSVKKKDLLGSISTVKEDALAERVSGNVVEAMRGLTSGVKITSSGQPGSSATINIRGLGSLTNNNPLFIIDGAYGGSDFGVNVEDIESIQVLKDASSAAIYGSRAANGVVLITTKAGAEDNAKVALNVQYGMTKVAKSMEALNTEQYRELQKEIGAVNPADLEGLTDQTDWFDEVYKTGQTQNYQVSVSNGNEKMKYFLSAGYLDEKGILEGTYFKRYSFRANIDNQIRSWLNVSANISYSDNIGNTGIISGTGANRGGVVLSVINTPTYAPIWDPEKPNQYNKNFYGVNIMNPMENLARQKNNKTRKTASSHPEPLPSASCPT